jgi:molybdopterin-synthase adenylyltransferase
MNSQLNKSLIERFSRQIILKDIGTVGQKKILTSKVLIIGVGGLGSPVAELLSRAGVGTIGIVDDDKVSLSNLHRQSLYTSSSIGKLKVKIAKEEIKKINNNIKVKTYKFRLNSKNLKKIISDYDYIVDGTDNFKTKFLLNDFCYKFRKILVTGAISKFDGHIFTFNFENKKIPCLRCFFQESNIEDNLLNCESEGILGTVAGIIGSIQANEILKKILNIGKGLDGYILILDLFNLNFRKVKLKKRKNCFCK